MIKRQIETKLKELSSQFPVVAILGPRQSGKTTIALNSFTNYEYLSLEDLDNRNYVKNDPRGFLDSLKNKNGIIIDEFQYVPDLLSYIKTYVDFNKRPGFFVLTGSQNFLMNQAITQSLAGRIAILTLLPLSLEELKGADILPESYEQVIFNGFYAPIYQNNSPLTWYKNYINTYVERDVRDLTFVKDLAQFQIFMKLCAGRIGQSLDVTSLSNDLGVDQKTVESWLTALEASYIIFRLHPYFKNFSKRFLKNPKLYFYDTGLACNLLGLSSASDLSSHYLKGGLFENFIIADVMKHNFNFEKLLQIHFWRDESGHEIDCIIDQAGKQKILEIKAGKTISSNYFDNINFWFDNIEKASTAFIIYGGDQDRSGTKAQTISWKNLDQVYK